ncbi:ribonuclease H-like domain-containing protein [Zopfochytrium polystomum]|nr:ribonuclease H-like domain-containing protein [Zopfochytrium polystomum]
MSSAEEAGSILKQALAKIGVANDRTMDPFSGETSKDLDFILDVCFLVQQNQPRPIQRQLFKGLKNWIELSLKSTFRGPGAEEPPSQRRKLDSGLPEGTLLVGGGPKPDELSRVLQLLIQNPMSVYIAAAFCAEADLAPHMDVVRKVVSQLQHSDSTPELIFVFDSWPNIPIDRREIIMTCIANGGVQTALALASSDDIKNEVTDMLNERCRRFLSTPNNPTVWQTQEFESFIKVSKYGARVLATWKKDFSALPALVCGARIASTGWLIDQLNETSNIEVDKNPIFDLVLQMIDFVASEFRGCLVNYLICKMLSEPSLKRFGEHLEGRFEMKVERIGQQPIKVQPPTKQQKKPPLPLYESHIDVTFIGGAEQLKRAAEVILNSKVVCLDCEWRPEALSLDKNNTIAPSTLQIATMSSSSVVNCFVIGVTEIDSKQLEGLLGPLFGSSRIRKVGFQFAQDVKRLQIKCPGLPETITNFLDFASKNGLKNTKGFGFRSTKGMSLSTLLEIVLKKSLDKSYRISNWDRRPLRDEQLKYAAYDVLSLMEVYSLLHEN